MQVVLDPVVHLFEQDGLFRQILFTAMFVFAQPAGHPAKRFGHDLQLFGGIVQPGIGKVYPTGGIHAHPVAQPVDVPHHEAIDAEIGHHHRHRPHQ